MPSGRHLKPHLTADELTHTSAHKIKGNAPVCRHVCKQCGGPASLSCRSCGKNEGVMRDMSDGLWIRQSERRQPMVGAGELRWQR
jgi:hypothetical protein